MSKNIYSLLALSASALATAVGPLVRVLGYREEIESIKRAQREVYETGRESV